MRCKRLRLRHKRKKFRNTILISVAFAITLFLAFAVFAELPKSKTVVLQENFETYTKWYFSRGECRYIFPEGSCQVVEKNCDKNTYDYIATKLDVKIDCITGTVVYNTNNQPVIKGYTKTDSGCEFKVTEGETVSLKPSGFDPDPEIGPAGKLIWTFYKPFNVAGKWLTKKGDAGVTKSKLKLSDGELSDEIIFCVDVEKSNSAPVLSEIKDMKIKEGETIKLSPKCIDPDGDKVTIKISGYMTTTTKAVSYTDSGDKSVVVTCSDPDGEYDTESFKLTVEDINRAPLIAASNVVVEEEKTATIIAKGTDLDGDKVTLTYSQPFDSTGKWKTRFGDAGVHDAYVIASDGKTKSTKKITVTVKRINKAPTIGKINDVTVTEGDTVTVTPNVKDANGDKVTLKWSGWMNSNTKKTGYSDAGVYAVTLSASDGKSETKQTFKVTVLNKNRPPVITKIK